MHTYNRMHRQITPWHMATRNLAQQRSALNYYFREYLCSGGQALVHCSENNYAKRTGSGTGGTTSCTSRKRRRVLARRSYSIPVMHHFGTSDAATLSVTARWSRPGGSAASKNVATGPVTASRGTCSIQASSICLLFSKKSLENFRNIVLRGSFSRME